MESIKKSIDELTLPPSPLPLIWRLLENITTSWARTYAKTAVAVGIERTIALDGECCVLWAKLNARVKIMKATDFVIALKRDGGIALASYACIIMFIIIIAKDGHISKRNMCIIIN